MCADCNSVWYGLLHESDALFDGYCDYVLSCLVFFRITIVKQIFVCGFLFSPCKDYVALIRKNKPEWQRGKLNGIGGKLEIGETIKEAMMREFSEEAGMWINYWQRFCFLYYPTTNAVIHFFKATLHREEDERLLTSVTDEEVAWYFRPHWCQKEIIPNLKWLIPLAQGEDFISAEVEGDPTK